VRWRRSGRGVGAEHGGSAESAAMATHVISARALVRAPWKQQHIMLTAICATWCQIVLQLLHACVCSLWEISTQTPREVSVLKTRSAVLCNAAWARHQARHEHTQCTPRRPTCSMPHSLDSAEADGLPLLCGRGVAGCRCAAAPAAGRVPRALAGPLGLDVGGRAHAGRIPRPHGATLHHAAPRRDRTTGGTSAGRSCRTNCSGEHWIRGRGCCAGWR
jgi:hypothetical protein